MLLTACHKNGKETWPEYSFKDSLVVRHTAIRDQGAWPAGWIYSTLGMVESDRIKVGDSINLSGTYLIRRHVEELLLNPYGEVKTEKHTHQFKGTPYSCIHIMNKAGIVTYACYRQKLAVSKNEFFKKINSGNVQVMLDTSFAYVPYDIGLYGAVYTPVDLARSLYMEDSYEGFISDTDVKKGEERMALPGDLRMESYINVSQDDMINIIDKTLHGGYSLVWMGDTTETTYSSAHGFAYWPGNVPTNAEEREIQLHNGLTRPDHCMQIVGIACGMLRNLSSIFGKSERFFVCRDSHGLRGPYAGLVYLSEDYIRMKTVAIYRHKPVLNLSF